MLDPEVTARLEEMARQYASQPQPAFPTPAVPDTAETLVNCRVHNWNFYMEPRASQCMEMLVVCRGTLTELIDGRELNLQEGDLLLTSPHTPHGVLPSTPECLAVNIDVTPYFFDMTGDIFRGTSELSAFLWDILRKNPTRGQYLMFKIQGHLPIHKLLDVLLMNYFLHPEEEASPWTAKDRDRIASACVSSILFYLYKEVAPTLCHIPLDECITLRHIIQNYMEQNYRNATLRELSQLANCAESTMSRNVQKLTGHSFTELLQQIRFEKAKVLLETTILPIADIATAVGYECYSFFYRRFRELYGCTPSKYRRQHNTKKVH